MNVCSTYNDQYKAHLLLGIYHHPSHSGPYQPPLIQSGSKGHHPPSIPLGQIEGPADNMDALCQVCLSRNLMASLVHEREPC